MYKNYFKTYKLLIFVFSISNSIIVSSAINQTQYLVNHVVKSIKNADNKTSQLNSDILKLEGMSSDKVRHLLNNICSLKNGRYLEIGVWKGSTFVSALYNNTKLLEATAIDNWAQFTGPKQEFQNNLNKFILPSAYKFYESDCFKFDIKNIKNKINIYFYDGGHTFEEQRLAFAYYNEILEDQFIAIVDDYNWKEVQDGTQAAFKDLGYKVLYEKFLPSSQNMDTSTWWNGIYVAVISKK
ncbi:MAG: class I SAM-dependent methyltransferase [Candidatus Babeliales bacterium]|nr:class I SAM-dependent methyltransferase [Candidatus Babeliales bacterium]